MSLKIKLFGRSWSVRVTLSCLELIFVQIFAITMAYVPFVLNWLGFTPSHFEPIASELKYISLLQSFGRYVRRDSANISKLRETVQLLFQILPQQSSNGSKSKCRCLVSVSKYWFGLLSKKNGPNLVLKL